MPKYAFSANPADTTFRPNHYTFEVAATFYPRHQVIAQLGEDRLQSRPAVSFQVGFMYSRVLRCGLGFGVGFRWGKLPVITYVDVPKERLSPQFRSYGDQKEFSSFYDINYEQFPLELSYRTKLSNHYSLTFTTGAALEFVLDGQLEESITATDEQTLNYEHIFQLVVNVNTNRKVFVTIPFQIMGSRVYKGRHQINFGICYSLALRPVADGEYVFFPDRSDYSLGSVAIHNSFVGLKFSYTLLGKKR